MARVRLPRVDARRCRSGLCLASQPVSSSAARQFEGSVGSHFTTMPAATGSALLVILGRHAHIAHMREGEGHDLARVGGIGHDLLITRHGGVEDKLGHRLARCAKSMSRRRRFHRPAQGMRWASWLGFPGHGTTPDVREFGGTYGRAGRGVKGAGENLKFNANFKWLEKARAKVAGRRGERDRVRGVENGGPQMELITRIQDAQKEAMKAKRRGASVDGADDPGRRKGQGNRPAHGRGRAWRGRCAGAVWARWSSSARKARKSIWTAGGPSWLTRNWPRCSVIENFLPKALSGR